MATTLTIKTSDLSPELKKLQEEWIKKNGQPKRYNDLDIELVSKAPKPMNSTASSHVNLAGD